jgi:hypothetical protein
MVEWGGGGGARGGGGGFGPPSYIVKKCPGVDRDKVRFCDCLADGIFVCMC